jgi:hypothetical protein
MSNLLRRIRGAVVIGLLWAVPWGVAGMLASPVIRRFAHAPPPRSVFDRLFDGVFIGWYGFLAGLVFSLVFAFVARRKAIADLTPGRMVLWGMASSVLLTAPPMIAMLASRSDGWRAEDPFYLGGSLLLSAGCAVASLLLARRGQPGERELLNDLAASPLASPSSAPAAVGSTPPFR